MIHSIFHSNMWITGWSSKFQRPVSCCHSEWHEAWNPITSIWSGHYYYIIQMSIRCGPALPLLDRTICRVSSCVSFLKGLLRMGELDPSAAVDSSCEMKNSLAPAWALLLERVLRDGLVTSKEGERTESAECTNVDTNQVRNQNGAEWFSVRQHRPTPWNSRKGTNWTMSRSAIMPPPLSLRIRWASINGDYRRPVSGCSWSQAPGSQGAQPRVVMSMEPIYVYTRKRCQTNLVATGFKLARTSYYSSLPPYSSSTTTTISSSSTSTTSFTFSSNSAYSSTTTTTFSPTYSSSSTSSSSTTSSSSSSSSTSTSPSSTTTSSSSSTTPPHHHPSSWS